MDPKDRRRQRRHLTHTIRARRRAISLAIACPDDALADTWFAARARPSCTCRKRRRGRPREGVGGCTSGARHHIYKARQQRRMLRDLLVIQGADPDDEEIGCAQRP